MKKLTLHIISIVAAAYFLFAGTGYNVVKLCHDGCKMLNTATYVNEISSKIDKKHDCCKKEQKVEDKKCCKKMHVLHFTDELANVLTKKGCYILRASVDTPIEVTFVNSILITKHFKKLFFNTLELKVMNQDLLYSQIYPPPEFEFQLQGREILTLKAVLRI